MSGATERIQMNATKELQPGDRPLDIEMAFGEPDAMEKAAARMKLHDWCDKEKMHCPWLNRCQNDPSWICLLHEEERSRISESPDKT